MAGMLLGRLSAAGEVYDLVAIQPGALFNSLDEAMEAGLAAGNTAALLGPLFSDAQIASCDLETIIKDPLPARVDFRPVEEISVCALLLSVGGRLRVFVPESMAAAENGWVELPRLAELYSLASQDRKQQRTDWIAKLRSINADDWPDDVDQSAAGLERLSTPALRMLVAYLAEVSIPVTGVNQPKENFRGAQTGGVTLPLFRYPLSEPDCYLRVIAGREGKLEAINAYDLNAGISIGPIQFNVHRGTIFWFLRRFEGADPILFERAFGPLDWATTVDGGKPVLTIGQGHGTPIRLVGGDSASSIKTNAGYFQSGRPGDDNFSQIDKALRTDHAGRFRDAVVWPHVQDLVLEISAEWLAPGLDAIHKAGISEIDAVTPNRDLFVLKALLLSTFVRYSACLAPLLKALAPYASIADKLASVETVLRAKANWSGCSHARREKLANRMTQQRGEALRVWEAIMRLAPHRVLAATTGIGLPLLAHDDHDCCDDNLIELDIEMLNRVQDALSDLDPNKLVRGERASGDGYSDTSSLLRSALKPLRIVAGPGKSLRGSLVIGDILIRQTSRRFTAAIVTDPDPGAEPGRAGVPGSAQTKVLVRTARGKDAFWIFRDRRGRMPTTIRVARLAGTRTFSRASIRVTEDVDLAVPSFHADERATVLQPLLSPTGSLAAANWNIQRHPAQSGVAPAQIVAALERYVDMNSVRAAIESYNHANPGKQIGMGAPPIDAIFVEAVHQFQRKIFSQTGQHDAMAGELVLDSLGLFLGRSGLESVDVANTTAQARLNAVKNRLPGANDNPGGALAITAANWFRQMVSSAFLGETFSSGIHAALMRRLRTAERHLLSQPPYAGMTPVALGAAMGIREFHRGARPTKMTKSLHTFGLATDLNYFGNPWIKGDEFTKALARAGLLVSGRQPQSGQIGTILHRMGSSGDSTSAMFDKLALFDGDFRTYLSFIADDDGLAEAIAARRADGTAGIFQNAGETDAAAAGRWKGTIVSDLARLRRGPTFVNGRDPRDGFLNLHRDFVVALRDFGCLAWGAVDFGPNANGDVMHFDCRNTGLGRIVCEGFKPPERECA